MALHERYYYRYLNYTGPTAYTAFAFDTTNILLHLLKDPANHTPQRLQQALLKMPPFEGVTGRLHFNKEGNIQREVDLLTIRGNQIQDCLKNPSLCVR